jgi:hypothetical protein
MRVFDLDRKLVSDYEHISRFIHPHPVNDIDSKVDEFYAGGRLRPDPLIDAPVSMWDRQ